MSRKKMALPSLLPKANATLRTKFNQACHTVLLMFGRSGPSFSGGLSCLVSHEHTIPSLTAANKSKYSSSRELRYNHQKRGEPEHSYSTAYLLQRDGLTTPLFLANRKANEFDLRPSCQNVYSHS
ncbi:hypothetical protein TNCV_2649401 [Trichonephila clavipes]|nr:hypothetical protein TNCV_2649401 [Trichonephila clavipes]